MDPERLQQIETLTRSIKNKTLTIIGKTRELEQVNDKLELFLRAIDSYGISSNENINNNVGTNTGPCMKKYKINNKGNGRVDNKANDKIDSKTNENTTIEDINDLFAMNKPHKNIALQIFKLLKEHEVVSLDGVVRNIKLSKYKVIEILNIMVRKGIVSKYFDKGFMYKI